MFSSQMYDQKRPIQNAVIKHKLKPSIFTQFCPLVGLFVSNTSCKERCKRMGMVCEQKHNHLVMTESSFTIMSINEVPCSLKSKTFLAHSKVQDGCYISDDLSQVECDGHSFDKELTHLCYCVLKGTHRFLFDSSYISCLASSQFTFSCCYYCLYRVFF